MALAQLFIPELKHEASNTRKVFERLTDEHFNWKPHEKSFSLGGLASHIAHLPLWISLTINTSEFDLVNGGFPRTSVKTFQEVRDLFEERFNAALTALSSADDEHLKEVWLLKNGDVKLFEMPRSVVIRSIAMNHSVHHRGELIVYMRLLNLKVPGLYGPSADEK